MMLSELVADVRRSYVANFSMALRAQPSPQILVEPARRTPAGEFMLNDGGLLGFPSREDVVLRTAEGASPISIGAPTMISFEPVHFPDWAGLEMRVFPFHWCAALYDCVHPGQPDWQPLDDWFSTGFGGEDEWVSPKAATERGLLHYLNAIQVAPDRYELVVDFGTASGEAFFAIASAITAAGFRSADVRASTMRSA